MTNRELIHMLLECDMEAEVFFEMNFDDEEDSVWFDVSNIFYLPTEGPEDPPIILLQDVPEINHELN